MVEPFGRTKLSAGGRSFRSSIAQLASAQGLLRGTLSERSSKCGKPNCHCANDELHLSVYLVQSHGGKLRQICVPKPWREFGCLRRRALWPRPLAVLHDEVHVMARVSHLPGQQIDKRCAVLRCIVVSALLVRHQLICRLLRNVPIEVVLLQIGNGSAENPLSLRAVDAGVLYCWSRCVPLCNYQLRCPHQGRRIFLRILCLKGDNVIVFAKTSLALG